MSELTKLIGQRDFNRIKDLSNEIRSLALKNCERQRCDISCSACELFTADSLAAELEELIQTLS